MFAPKDHEAPVSKELFIQTGADNLPAGEGYRTRWVRWIDRSYRDVLVVPGARALIGASAASEIGNWLYNAALLGYVYSATSSIGWVGAATICRLLPYVLLGPFGGALADRYSRRAVLLAGDALRVLVMAPSLRRSPAVARWRWSSYSPRWRRPRAVRRSRRR